ncbi:MAG: hypothetical protein ABIH23_02815 [bacterium]
MCENITTVRVTDRNYPYVFEDNGKPFLILFESRYSTTVAMLDAFQSAFNRFKEKILCGVCVVEDAPSLCKRFKVFGVPTVVAVLKQSELGRTLGTRSADQLTSLTEIWLRRAAAQENKVPEKQILYESD